MGLPAWRYGDGLLERSGTCLKDGEKGTPAGAELQESGPGRLDRVDSAERGDALQRSLQALPLPLAMATLAHRAKIYSSGQAQVLSGPASVSLHI
jgi:hypothetical protein